MGSGDVSFDKVFAVPQAPGHLINVESITDSHDGQDKSTESSESSVDEVKESNDKEGTRKFLLIKISRSIHEIPWKK